MRYQRIVPSPKAATTVRPLRGMLTAQLWLIGASHLRFPLRSNSRRYDSAPRAKDCRSGAMAKLREISPVSSFRGAPSSFGEIEFCQSVTLRPGVSGPNTEDGKSPGFSERSPAENVAGDMPMNSYPNPTRSPSAEADT